MAFRNHTFALSLSAAMILLAGCSQEPNPAETNIGPYPNNPYAVWRTTLDLPEGSPSYDHPAAGDCSATEGDDAILACAEAHFWRVFQGEIEDRESFWNAMMSLEEKLSENVNPIKKARFLFQRAQLAMAYALEQSDMTPENLAVMSPE